MSDRVVPPSKNPTPASPASGYSRADFVDPDQCDLNTRTADAEAVDQYAREPAPALTVDPQLPHTGYSRADFVDPEKCTLGARTGPAHTSLHFDRNPSPLVPEANPPIRVAASIGGYPVHTMIVPVTIGCFLSSLACDLLFRITGDAHPWNTLAFLTLLGGLVTGLVAAAAGWIDFQSLPAGRIRKIAQIHMRLNVIVLSVYTVNALIRYLNPDETSWPLLLSGMTMMVLTASGWLGARLVAEAGVGLDPTTDEVARDRVGGRSSPVTR